MKPLSPKAYSFLVAIRQHNLSISAPSIMKHFSVGRRAALSGLKELRDRGYIKTGIEKIGSRLMTVSYVTDAGDALLFGAVGSPFVESQNVTPVTPAEHISRNTISTVISKKDTLTESRGKTKTMNIEVSDMSWGDIFKPTSDPGAELREEIKKDRERKRAESAVEKQKSNAVKLSVKQDLQKDRRTYREKSPKSEWKVRDVCYEFADRIEQHFHIAPWKVTHSKFSAALGGARDRLETNGEIEVAAMDIFFSQININEYKDAEVLWRLFVSRLPGLIGMAMMETSNAEIDEVSRKAHERALRESGYYDV